MVFYIFSYIYVVHISYILFDFTGFLES